MANGTTLLPEDVRFIRDIKSRIGSRMFGIDGIIDSLLVALMTGGHVLLEGNPGLGKTALVKTMGDALKLPTDKVGRIQFTPDLMPSDITGTLMPTREDRSRLAFHKGPIFRWLLLADEINRATPKTQAAMLEAMAEKQVTVLGKEHSLVDMEDASIRGGVRTRVRPPFMVMATQNPIDQEGTYNLPEAQSDRFMFKIRMPFPHSDILTKIISKEIKAEISDSSNEDVAESKASLVRLHRLNRAIRDAPEAPLVSEHIRNLVGASNLDAVQDLSLPVSQKRALSEFVDHYIRYPLGPRAAFSMELGTRALAVLRFIDTEALQGIADHAPTAFTMICIPAIRHRLKLKLGWDRDYSESAASAGLSYDQKMDSLLRQFVLLCAPEDEDYRLTLSDSIDTFLENPY